MTTAGKEPTPAEKQATMDAERKARHLAESIRINQSKMPIRQLLNQTKRRARKEKSIGLIVASILLENSKEAWEKSKTVPYGFGKISSGLR